MGLRLFLLNGTDRERRQMARDRYMDPRDITLVHGPEDIHGHEEGRIVYGRTGFTRHEPECLAFAKLKGFVMPEDD